jgi:hypothetical protein
MWKRILQSFLNPICNTVTFLAAVVTTVISSSAAPATLEELNSHLFTDASIVWEANADKLPKSFWVYQRQLPRVFSATVISNAIVLGSLQDKGFPEPSTKQTCIMAEPPCPCANVCNFSIIPDDAVMSFTSPSYKDASVEDIPGDQVIAKRAWDYTSQFGLDPAQLTRARFFTHLKLSEETGTELSNSICGRGIFLSRQLDGIAFFSASDDGEGAEGFSIEFGGSGKIRFFFLRWSDIEPYESQQTTSQQEIAHCIKAHKILVLPNVGEEDFFARLKLLAGAKKLTITKITPYYGEGIFGEMPLNDAPSKWIMPFAELDAIADFGNSNLDVRMVSPVLSSEVSRLLGK